MKNIIVMSIVLLMCSNLYALENRFSDYNADALQYYNQAVDLLAQYKTKEAKELFEKAVFAEPFFAEAFFNLGVLYQNRGDTVNALREYQKAVALYPRDAELYYNIGLIHLGNGNYEVAEDAFYEALFIDPDMNNARYHCADALRLQGKYDEALEEVQEMLDRDPNTADTYLLMGIIFDNKGDALREALFSYKKYIQFGGKDPRVRGWIDRLEYEL
ncbi:MAG: tetratricopeptide repeat protein [Candidatus Ancaeobacter aquaticus]|nr:tetratricopeptide repeat protein [Candidatus Ancaeobacter aquaticus]